MQKVPQVDKLVGLGVRPSGFHASPPKPELRSKRRSKAASSKEGTSPPHLKVEVQKYLSIDELHTFAI